MAIYHERMGEGPSLVLIHGWGLHGGLWGALPGALAARGFRVTVVDLPGHGRSRAVPAGAGLEAVAGQVREVLPGPAHWLGWSLGGLVALRAAQRWPEAVRRLALIGVSPRFVQGPDWPWAMAPAVLAGFADALRRDYRGTLLRFLSLQAGGDEQARETLRRLRAEAFRYGEPAPAALAAGLGWLRTTDLRAELPGLAAPALVIHGERDQLVPLPAARWLAARLPVARLETVARAGHAPFLSHPDQVGDALERFLHVPE